jgi:hypothetical protein
MDLAFVGTVTYRVRMPFPVAASAHPAGALAGSGTLAREHRPADDRRIRLAT